MNSTAALPWTSLAAWAAVGPVADPRSLAIARIVVFAIIAWRFDIESLVAFASLPPALVDMPFGTAWARGLVPTDPEDVRTLGWVVRLSASAASVGLLTRVSTWVATLSAAALFAIPVMYGHVGHSRHHLIWFGATLAASRCGDRLSADRLVRRWRGDPASSPAPARRYGFPFTVMLLTMGTAYFFSGFWKLAEGGVSWFASDNVVHLAAKLDYAGLGGDSALVRAHEWLPHIGAFGVVAFELSFVLLVLFQRTRVIALGAAFLFHTATFVAMGISFGTVLYCYLAFFNWPGAWRWLRGERQEAPAAIGGADTPSALLRVVALVLIGGNVTLGALGIDGWPLSCYPKFEAVHTPFVSSYVIEGVGADGRVVRLHDGQLGAPRLGPHFYSVFRGHESRVPGFEEAAPHRVERWRHLCTFVWGRHPALREARDVRFVLDDLDLSEGPDRPRRVRERPQFACEPPGHRAP